MIHIPYSILLVFVITVSCFAQPVEPAPFSIKGRVLDSSGKPVPRAVVQAYVSDMKASDGRLPVTTADDDGNFTIGVPRIGSYTMMVEKPSVGLPSTYNRFYYPADQARPAVLVEKGTQMLPIMLRLDPGAGILRAKIVDTSSKTAITNAEVRLCRLESPRYCFTSKMRSPQGMFMYRAVAEPFSLHISADGFEDRYEVFESGIRLGDVREVNVSLVRPSGRASARLAAPEVIFPTDGADLFGYPRLTRLQWSPVVGAKSYAIEVEVCQGVAKERVCGNSSPLQHPGFQPTSGLEGTSFEFNFVGRQPGRWRVWAFDSEGNPGIRTPWVTFFYQQ
jgi:hypothetical protein